MTVGDVPGAPTPGIREGKARNWDSWYAGDPPPWEIDRPQPVLVELANQGRLSGRVLDVGCGSGEHALLAAAHGARALGLDISPRAIERAVQKARERRVEAEFQVGDALRLDRLGEEFDVVIDSGMFQSFEAAERSLYASSLAAALRPGGTLFLTCVCDHQPGDWGPRRVSEAEIRTTFASGWEIDELRECLRERRLDAHEHPYNSQAQPSAIAWLAAIRHVPGPCSDPGLQPD
jgi:SAM-dependent methyltransferase